MIESFDPYAELGVSRGADIAQINRAYRRRSQSTHPDVEGGSEEAFERTKLAHETLTNEVRRKRYDETGVMDGAKPDNVRAAAIQVIESHMIGIFNGYVQSGFKENFDPRRADLVAKLKAVIQKEIEDSKKTLAIGEKALAFYQDMATRFVSVKNDDFMGRSMRNYVKNTMADIEKVKESIEPRNRALEMLSTCHFRYDTIFGMQSFEVDEKGQFVRRLVDMNFVFPKGGL